MEEKIGKNISYSDGIKVMVEIQPQVKGIARYSGPHKLSVSREGGITYWKVNVGRNLKEMLTS